MNTLMMRIWDADAGHSVAKWPLCWELRRKDATKKVGHLIKSNLSRHGYYVRSEWLSAPSSEKAASDSSGK